MTVDTTYAPVTATGNGTTDQFSFPYLVFQASHLSITIDGVATSAWSATGYGLQAGVTITFDSPPADQSAIVIQRIVPYTQDTDLENFDGNPSDVTEKQFDLHAMADQQLATQVGLSITVPSGSGLTNVEITDPAGNAGRTIIVNPAEDGFIYGSSGVDLVDDITPQLGGDLDLNGFNIDFPSTANVSDVLDEDAMGSDSATALATQQSIKAYVDTNTIGDVVSDTTPQLGGMLDVNGQAIGDGTLELLSFSETGSAVNEFTIANAATGNAPVLSATGDDANIGITLTPKGTGNITLGTMVFDSDQSIGAGQDNYILTYDDGAGTISLEANAGGSALNNIVEDTTPQLGAQLDVNGFGLGDGTLELLSFSETGSAVNEFTIANAATGNDPVLSATGDDANVGITLTPKGTGNVTLGTMAFDADQSIGAGQDNYVLTYDNGTGEISLEAAAGAGGGLLSQKVIGTTASMTTTTTTMPADDTIPQNTEGAEVVTVAITPNSSTNRLVIRATVHCSHSTGADTGSIALFQDSTANALAVSTTALADNTALGSIHLFHEMAAGTTSSTTFKIRAGHNDAGTLTVNGESGARLYGGVLISSIEIMEVSI